MEKQQIPQARCKDITYGRIICVYRSEKKDPYRMHITMGGNLVNYPDDCGTPTADLLTVKLMFNSIISTPNAKFMTINIKDFLRGIQGRVSLEYLGYLRLYTNTPPRFMA
jgi:hypothetical protein